MCITPKKKTQQGWLEVFPSTVLNLCLLRCSSFCRGVCLCVLCVCLCVLRVTRGIFLPCAMCARVRMRVRVRVRVCVRVRVRASLACLPLALSRSLSPSLSLSLSDSLSLFPPSLSHARSLALSFSVLLCLSLVRACVCAVTRVCHDLFICVIRLIPTCDSFIRVAYHTYE